MKIFKRGKNGDKTDIKLFNQGIIHLENNNIEQALTLFRQLYDNVNESLGAKGLCLSYSKAYALSRDSHFQGFIPDRPWIYCYVFGNRYLQINNDVDVLMALSELYMNSPLRDISEAVDCAVKAFNIRPDDKRVIKLCLTALLRHGYQDSLNAGISFVDKMTGDDKDADIDILYLKMKDKLNALISRTYGKAINVEENNGIQDNTKCCICEMENKTIKESMVKNKTFCICDNCLDSTCDLIRDSLDYKLPRCFGKEEGRVKFDDIVLLLKNKNSRKEFSNLSCFMCEAKLEDVYLMIGGARNYICDGCIGICVDLMEKHIFENNL